jgi:hypothetical protein
LEEFKKMNKAQEIDSYSHVSLDQVIATAGSVSQELLMQNEATAENIENLKNNLPLMAIRGSAFLAGSTLACKVMDYIYQDGVQPGQIGDSSSQGNIPTSSQAKRAYGRGPRYKSVKQTVVQ